MSTKAPSCSKGAEAEILWASFDLSVLSQTTKDLRGYETQYETIKLSIEPATIPDGEDASLYAVFPKTDLALDMKFASLAAKTSPTAADIALTVSSDDMAQTITLSLSGTTTAQWATGAFDPAQAVNLAEMSADDLQSLLSQAVIKGGLLFLPYLICRKSRLKTLISGRLFMTLKEQPKNNQRTAIFLTLCGAYGILRSIQQRR